MPLPRYGVAIGKLIRFYRDPSDDFGRWYHGHVEIATPSGAWTSALAVERENGTLFLWQVRFNSQATQTDNDGHPI